MVLVNAETADAAPNAGWAADSVRERGIPVCGPAGLAAGAGAGAGVVVFVVAMAPDVYVPAPKAFLCGHSLALCLS